MKWMNILTDLSIHIVAYGLELLWQFVQILAPLPIGFAVFLVHLATIPITGTGINPARSLGAAIIYNKDHSWDDHVSFPQTIYIPFSFQTRFQSFFLTIFFGHVSGCFGLGPSLVLHLLLFTMWLSSEQSPSSPETKLKQNIKSSGFWSRVLSCFYCYSICVKCVSVWTYVPSPLLNAINVTCKQWRISQKFNINHSWNLCFNS